MSAIAFPPPPPTSNTLTAEQRAALVRSSKKLSKVLGDVPRVVDGDSSPRPSLSLELTRTRTHTRTCTPPVPSETESSWLRRKVAHLPPLLKLPSASVDTSPHTSTSHGSARAVAPSGSSSACEPSFPDALLLDVTPRRTKLERLRQKLGPEVPATAVFPAPTPRTFRPPSPHPRTRSATKSPSQADDVQSVTFSISSDESAHAVTFTAARVPASPHKTKHVYRTGPLPPVPPIPTHLISPSSSSSRRAASNDGDDGAGLIRPRQKMAAGSRIGGSDFKAARRAKREGRALHGMAEPGEMVEMVGFMR